MCVIQHMLRNIIILKAMDQVNITFIIFMITYFILMNTQFNVSHLLICSIKSFIIVRDPNFIKKPILALGHLIAYALEVKYNLPFSNTLDHTPSLLIYHSFHILYGERR